MSHSGFISFFSLLCSLALSFNVNAEFESDVSGAEQNELQSDIVESRLIDEEFDYYDEVPCTNDITENDNQDNSFISYLEKTHSTLSSGVELLARKIDDFFTSDGKIYDSSGSYLRIRQNFVSREGGVTESTTDTRFRLRLPKTQKKLKLFFETSSEKNPDNISNQVENTPTEEIKDGDSVLGIQSDSGEKYGFKFKPTVGVRLGADSDLFVKFRLRKEKEYVKWNLKWHETLQWYDSIGWGVDSYFELSKKLSDDALFRSSTFARWTNEEDNFDLSQVFSMYHVFSKKRALTYYVGAYGVSEPSVYATYYLLGANYRQNIHKDYLFLEVEPQIRYQKENAFDAEHSITFRLELFFKK